uniref:Leucine rich repeat protein n=1 Tax=Mimivirus LCMiAC01 TaxID=2506608 RepID=A0A481Z0D8_9VIRU|nr:MAG: leucine rich repeat protein [Mimivirus LCMiAC01]
MIKSLLLYITKYITKAKAMINPEVCTTIVPITIPEIVPETIQEVAQTSKIVYYSRRNLETELELCKKKKLPKLYLSNKNLTEIPTELKEYTWVTNLMLRCNNITKIDRDSLPPNLEILDVDQNDIKSISPDDIHDKIINLSAEHNNIETFDGTLFYGLLKLSLSRNKMINFIAFPPKVTECELSYNTLTNLPEYNDSLISLDIEGNNLSELGKQNTNIEEIDCSNNEFVKFPKFSNSIKKINISSNIINTIDIPFPDSLEEFACTNCELRSITVAFPQSIKIIDVENNYLKKMIDLPSSVKDVNVSNNYISELGYIPISVIDLDCSNNKIKRIQPILKNRDTLTLVDYGNEYENECTYYYNNNRQTHYSYYNSGYNQYYQMGYRRWNMGNTNATNTNPYYIKNTRHVTI